MKTMDPLLSLPSTPRQSSAAAGPLRAEAWKKTMESEQMAAMQRARSVPLGEQRMPESERQTQARLPHAPETKVTHRQVTSPKMENAPSAFSGSADAEASSPVFGMPGHAMKMPSTYASMANPFIEHATALEQSCANLIACIAERFDRKWPLRNVHIEHGDNGVTIWIRDAKLADDQSAYPQFIEKMKAAVRDDGMTIARIMINGKQVN